MKGLREKRRHKPWQNSITTQFLLCPCYSLILKIHDTRGIFECCEATISEKDFNTLKSALILPEENPDFNSVLTKWNNWESSLRDELVKLRAVKRGLDSDKYMSGSAGESGVSELARDAFNASSPLEAETLLNRGRWEYLEMLESGHFLILES